MLKVCNHVILICVLPPGKRVIIKLIAQIPKTTTTTQETTLTRRLTYYTIDGNFTSKTQQAFLLKGNFIFIIMDSANCKEVVPRKSGRLDGRRNGLEVVSLLCPR